MLRALHEARFRQHRGMVRAARRASWLALLSVKFLALVAGLIALPSPARAAASDPDPVDVALVLAVDISFSMTMHELALQRDGYVEAFRDPRVHAAIAAGPHRRIAVSYLEWAGAATREVIAPWRIIDGPDDAEAFADFLAEQPLRRTRRTSISAALAEAASLFETLPATPLRRVIDMSGDGPNNEGRIVTIARNETIDAGITINGLPIMLARGGALDIPDLDHYYIDCVIGGPGAFIVPLRAHAEFADAIRRKLILEIADLAPPRPLIHRAGERPGADCLIGERMFQDWRERNQMQ
ncbi:DUF1194 domain-containing protein [Saliniramus sp.]|uniref:DUF1194 domain-containing protein n=1 Tax=Saliniramus sp. TaxID=2986772 RepID=UPI002D1FBE26|nr:DUF1194 domain-containing protein [Saliniramus sp.]